MTIRKLFDRWVAAAEQLAHVAAFRARRGSATLILDVPGTDLRLKFCEAADDLDTAASRLDQWLGIEERSFAERRASQRTDTPLGKIPSIMPDDFEPDPNVVRGIADYRRRAGFLRQLARCVSETDGYPLTFKEAETYLHNESARAARAVALAQYGRTLSPAVTVIERKTSGPRLRKA